MRSIYVVTYEVGAWEDSKENILRAFYDFDDAYGFIESLVGTPYELKDAYGRKERGTYELDEFDIVGVEVEPPNHKAQKLREALDKYDREMVRKAVMECAFVRVPDNLFTPPYRIVKQDRYKVGDTVQADDGWIYVVHSVRDYANGTVYGLVGKDGDTSFQRHHSNINGKVVVEGKLVPASPRGQAASEGRGVD